jgi:CubicO group peptidase (beta-lactamase class C family)
MIQVQAVSTPFGRWTTTIAILLTLFFAPNVIGDDAFARADVDALVDPLIENREVVGLVIGVVYEGERHIFSYGSRKREESQVPDGKTVFEIGSITKPVTGLLLAQLVHEGKVKLDDPIAKFLPEKAKLPRFRDGDIRLVDLATHTSGLPALPTNLVPTDPLNRYADYSSAQLLDYLHTESQRNVFRSLARKVAGNSEQPPYVYSNLGVGLLGHVLERACEEPYEKLIANKLCAPLNLVDTRISLTDDQQARRAIGYNAMGKSVPAWDFDCLAGAAALHSTCDDMLDFLSVLIDPMGSELAEAITLTLEPRQRIDADTSVGLCWQIVDKVGVVAHGGQTGGFQSMIWFRPKSKFGVVVLANTRNIIIERIPPRMFRMALGLTVDPIPIPKPVRLDPQLLQSYVGEYRQNQFNTAEIRLTDDLLVVRPSNSDEYPIYPKSEVEFFNKSSNSSSITFLKNDDGLVTGMVHQEGDTVLRYQRVSTP